MATAASYFEFPLGPLLRELKSRILRILSADCAILGLTFSSRTVWDWRSPSQWKSAYDGSLTRVARMIPSRKAAIASTVLLWGLVVAVLISVTAALAAALPALLLGAIAGYYTLAVFHCVRLRRAEDMIRGGTVLLTFNGKQLDLTAVPALLRRFCSPLRERSTAAALAGITSALALLAFQGSTQAFTILFRSGSIISAESLLAWSGPVLISIWFMGTAAVAGRFEGKVLARVQERVDRANGELRRIAELDGYLVAMNASACSLRNDPAQRYQRALREYVSSNCAATVLDPASSLAVIQALKALAQQEIRQTQTAVQHYQNALMQFRELRGYARSTQDLSLKRSVDVLGERLAQSRKLMEQQDFSGLSQLLDALQREMQSLEAQLTRAHQSRSESARVPSSGMQVTSPYEKLGISRDATTEQIRRLRTKLVQIYHPDAFGGSPNAARMAEINAAVDQILKWRGEK